MDALSLMRWGSGFYCSENDFLAKVYTFANLLNGSTYLGHPWTFQVVRWSQNVEIQHFTSYILNITVKLTNTAILSPFNNKIFVTFPKWENTKCWISVFWLHRTTWKVQGCPRTSSGRFSTKFGWIKKCIVSLDSDTSSSFCSDPFHPHLYYRFPMNNVKCDPF